MRDAQETTRLGCMEDQLMEEQDQVVELSKRNSTLQQEVILLRTQLAEAEDTKEKLLRVEKERFMEMTRKVDQLRVRAQD